MGLVGADGQPIRAESLTGVQHLFECGHIFWQRTSDLPPDGADVIFKIGFKCYGVSCGYCQKIDAIAEQRSTTEEGKKIALEPLGLPTPIQTVPAEQGATVEGDLDSQLHPTGHGERGPSDPGSDQPDKETHQEGEAPK